MTARSLGYANSEMSCDAPLMAYTIPIPRIILDTMNMATLGYFSAETQEQGLMGTYCRLMLFAGWLRSQ